MPPHPRPATCCSSTAADAVAIAAAQHGADLSARSSTSRDRHRCSARSQTRAAARCSHHTGCCRARARPTSRRSCALGCSPRASESARARRSTRPTAPPRCWRGARKRRASPRPTMSLPPQQAAATVATTTAWPWRGLRFFCSDLRPTAELRGAISSDVLRRLRRPPLPTAALRRRAETRRMARRPRHRDAASCGATAAAARKSGRHAWPSTVRSSRASSRRTLRRASLTSSGQATPTLSVMSATGRAAWSSVARLHPEHNAAHAHVAKKHERGGRHNPGNRAGIPGFAHASAEKTGFFFRANAPRR